MKHNFEKLFKKFIGRTANVPYQDCIAHFLANHTGLISRCI